MRTILLILLMLLCTSLQAVAPAFRDVATTAGSTSDTVVISVPSATVDDDIMIAGIYTESDGQAITAPGGWTLLVTMDNGTGAFRTRWYWRRASSEPADYTWTATGSSWLGGGITAYSGAITTGSPIDANGSGDTGGADTSAVATSITTTVADTLIVYGMHNVGGVTATPPSGMTERVDVASYYGADVAQASAGATGNKTATLASSQTWACFLLALKPPAADVYPAATINNPLQY